MMRHMPDMQHDEPNMALKTGQRGGTVWEFPQAGKVK